MTLIALLLLCFVIALLATIAAIGLRHDCSLKRRMIIIIVPFLDSILSYFVLEWLGLGPSTVFVGSAMFGILSLLGVQALLSPRRLLVFKLAWQQLRRRQRQAALLMAGLMIGSAIISSSLIVGDSLDETVRKEVEAAWGSTDIVISGYDATIGQVVEIPSSIVEDLRTQDVDAVHSIQAGRITTASVETTEGIAEPNVPWFALEHQEDARIGSKSNGLTWFELEEASRFSNQSVVVINQALADELELDEGDEIELGWFVRSDEGIERTKQFFLIHDVVSMANQGQLAGTTAPAIFTDLQTAQTLQQAGQNVTTIRLSIKGLEETRNGYSPLIEQLELALNQTIDAEDSGLQFLTDDGSDSFTIASSQGLGRIQASLIRSIKQNQSDLMEDSSLLEVLQVPLISLEANGSELLTLADGDVNHVVSEEEAIWHWGPGGFGYERNDDESWVWRVPSGSIITDVSIDDGYGFAAYEEGLILGNSSDEDSTIRLLKDKDMVAVELHEGTWFALEEGLNRTLWFGDLLNDSETPYILDINAPSTVLNWDLEHHSGDLYLKVEGLLSVDYYKRAWNAEESIFVEISEAEWPVSSSNAPSVCTSGKGSIVSSQEAWCIESPGIIVRTVEDGSIRSIRLPILSEAGGFGTLPQMFFAIDGDVPSLNVTETELMIGDRLQMISGVANGSLNASGLFQFAFGSDDSQQLMINGSFTENDQLSQLSELESVVLGLINIHDGETLAAAEEDERSMLVFGSVSLEERIAIENHLNELVGFEEMSISIRTVKLDAMEQAEASSGVLSAMFLVFGSFTIAAGVLLVVTIVMMLVDVRQKEYATVRALGFTRSDLRYMTMIEGSIAAFFGCGIGSLLGMGLAWFIGIGFSSVFANAGTDVFTFHVDSSSLASGWFWGFHLSILTLFFSALWSSRLIIVHALKSVPQRIPKHVPWGIYIFLIVMAGAALGSIGLFFIGGQGVAHSMWILFGCSALLFTMPILFWVIPVLRARRKIDGTLPVFREAPRRTIGWSGVALLVWTGLPSSLDPIRNDLTPNELSFILIGLVQVFAGVFVLAALAPTMIRGLLRLPKLSSGPVLPVALSYPLQKPLRTAVVMGMFSITVFSVIVLSGYTLQFDNYSSSFVEESEGEFELMLSSSRSRPLQLEGPVEEWGLENSNIEQIDAVGRVYRAQAFLENDEETRSPYILRGVDQDFVNHGGISLYIWDEGLGDSSEEAWKSMHQRTDVVFVDASFGLESSLDGASIGIFPVKVGENITIIDSKQPSHRRVVTVGGILEQSSYLFSAGVWMPSEPVIEQYDGDLTRVYVSVSPDSEASSSFDNTGVSYYEAAGKSEGEREAAAELSEQLSLDLEKEGIQVSLIAEEVALIQSLVLSILALFEGYLSIGLVIGIAGIGVVTYRSVSERRKHIGMLRAIGYTQGMVMRIHVVEVTWVALLGILNGIVVGLLFHIGLHSAVWEKEGASLVLPWTTAIVMFLGGWILVFLATLGPVRAASKIPPSEALRSSS